MKTKSSTKRATGAKQFPVRAGLRFCECMARCSPGSTRPGIRVNSSWWSGYIALVVPLVLSGCSGLPKGVQPVSHFDLTRYLGSWYEIARLDHSFERGLTQVTAEYTLRADGGVKVVNRGFFEKEGEWKEVEGKAYFVRGQDEGHLKVSFFGPFYGSYVVFQLDRDQYQYAFVAGWNKSYLWLLSRTPVASPEMVSRFVSRAHELGFDTDELIFVEHDVRDMNRDSHERQRECDLEADAFARSLLPLKQTAGSAEAETKWQVAINK